MNQYVGKPEAQTEITRSDPLTFRTRNNKEKAPPIMTETPDTAHFDTAHAQTVQDGPLATQKDLIELHKRMVTMFTTLNQGLSETADKRAKEDRDAVMKRLEVMEKSICELEGALRIELPPTIEKAVQNNLKSISPKGRGTFLGRVGFLVFTGGLVTLSVLYHAEISSTFNNLSEYAVSKWHSLSPFGDILIPRG